MIYAYNILTGYMAIRGSSFIHLPMFFAQLAFVSVPKDLGDGFEDMEVSFKDWYILALLMHLYLAILHLSILAVAFIDLTDDTT